MVKSHVAGLAVLRVAWPPGRRRWAGMDTRRSEATPKPGPSFLSSFSVCGPQLRRARDHALSAGPHKALRT